MKRRLTLLGLVIGVPALCLIAALAIIGAMNAYSRTYAGSDAVPGLATYAPRPTLFPIQSIDTMKDSRDMARKALTDPSFKSVIDDDMALIASAGATHAAIDTPYDPEFLPILREWVASARAHGLSVWFRGNFSGWEGWFGYARISRVDHIAMTKQFILNNPGLFADGDIFTACPECENGGPGDPRATGDTSGHRQFLIDEYAATRGAFSAIGKQVDSSISSMNLDVAKLVIDRPTADALGGVIAIDNYTRTPAQFAADIDALHAATGARIILGEFGASIPDLNGSLSDADQANFIEGLLAAMYYRADVVAGANYWVVRGGTTALVSDSGTAKPALSTIARYYKAPYALGFIHDDSGAPIKQAFLRASLAPDGSSTEPIENGYPIATDSAGRYQLFLPYPGMNMLVRDPSGTYPDLIYTPEAGTNPASQNNLILVPRRQSFWNRFLRLLGL